MEGNHTTQGIDPVDVIDKKKCSGLGMGEAPAAQSGGFAKSMKRKGWHLLY